MTWTLWTNKGNTMSLSARIDAIAQFLQGEDDELLYNPDGENVTLSEGQGNEFYECGCCSAYHRVDFYGDCRDDSERFLDLPFDAVIVDIDEPDYDEDEEEVTVELYRNSYHEILVGNIGTVYSGFDTVLAQQTFDTYVTQAKGDSGRAAGEDVTWIIDGNERRGYIGTNVHEDEEGYHG